MQPEGFTHITTDTPANQYYDARIRADGDPVYDRSVTCAAWVGGASTTYSDAPTDTATATNIALGDIALDNTDGGLDSLLPITFRDGTITLKLGYYGQAYTAFVVVATGVIDQIGQSDEHTLKVYLRGKMAKLDKAAQTNLFDATAPNASLEAIAKPWALGTVKWAPLVTYDPANLEFALNDGPFGVVSELRDQGVLLTQGSGWSASADAPDYGITRLTNPAGRMCASYTGTMALGAVTISQQPFGAWAAGVPGGSSWALQFGAVATAPLSNPSGTVARFQSTTAPGTYQQSLFENVAATIGQVYYCEIQCTAWTSGKIDVLASGLSASPIVCTINRVGFFRFSFVATTAGAILGFSWGKVLCDLQISGVKIWAATTIERLPAWLSYLCVTRGGLVAGDLDTAGTITALDATAPYKLNYYCQDSTRIPDILQQTMDSFLGWIYESRLGVLTVGRLTLPAATSILTLTDQELYGDISIRTDTVPGLSPVVAGQKNYSVHDVSDIAGSVFVPGTGDPTTAAQLQLEFLVNKKGNGNLPALYSTAAANSPMVTLLNDPLQIQTEANRRCGFWLQQRNFYSFSAFLDDTTSYTLNPGDTITILTKRFGMQNGLNLLVIGVKSRFLSNLVQITAWG